MLISLLLKLFMPVPSLPLYLHYPLLLIMVFLSNLISPLAPLCTTLQGISLNLYMPLVQRQSCEIGVTEEEDGDRERELVSKQKNPDFINMGLLIWAWAVLHLSQ